MGLLRGGCLCGGARFGISGPLAGIGHRHGSICRRAQGTAFRTRARARRERFRLLRGEDLITFVQSSPDCHRGVRRVCGSPACTWNGPGPEHARCDPASLGTVGIALGGLDDDPGQRPAMHVFVADKAPWDRITDVLRQYAASPLQGPPIPP